MTVIYRGPSGTTIDATALNHELEAHELVLNMHSDAPVRDESSAVGEPVQTQRDQATVRCELTRKGLPLDSEKGMHYERVEVLVRLLRRNLPEPAKVIAHMSDVEWADFQGSKAPSPGWTPDRRF